MTRSLVSLALATALAAAAPAWSMKMGEVVPCRPNMPQQVETLDGLFRVHVVCDHVLFEIPKHLLNRDMLVNTEFAALSTGTDYVAPGSVADSRVVRWVQRGSKIYLETVKYEMWAENASGLQRGVEAASLRTVLKAFEAVSEGKDGAPIIEVTPLFATDAPEGFAAEFMQHFRMQGIDSKRSYIESVKAFPQNVDVRFYQTWIADRKDVIESAGSDDPVPSALGFIFHTSIYLLPEQPMKPRYWDPRVGYFAVYFLDYGSGDMGGMRRGFIQRYRLEKKDPAAQASEPVKPIVFYISEEVPERWRPYMKRAVESWQGPLEKAGFKNAILARDAPTMEEDPKWDPEDVRYNVIRWTPSGRQNAMGPAVVDPRSGEVISSHAIFWHDVLKLLETWYFTQVGALDPRAQQLPLPEDLLGELLQYVVTHEIGHALGLRHNFKAPAQATVAQLRDPEWTAKWGTSTSIMSYARFNYVAQPSDKASLMPRFGPYDFFAIDWGYRTLGSGMTFDDEWPMLDALAAQQVEDPALRFGGEDTSALLDPTVSENVLGADPIEAADLGLKNIDRVARLLVTATARKGEGYSRLASKYESLVLQRHRELVYVSKLVGGVEETRYQAGRGTVPFQPVHPDRQREAVQFLVDRAFATPHALINSEILRRVTPDGGTRPLQGSNVDLLRRLVDPQVFQRMAEAKVHFGDGYIGMQMLEDLNNGLFDELDTNTPRITLYRRDLQRNYVTVLLAATGTIRDPITGSKSIEAESVYLDSGALPKASRRDAQQRSFSSPLANVADRVRTGAGLASEYRAALRVGVADLYKKIDAALPKVQDPETLAHLRELRSELSQVP
jgi:hypothetical protein